MKRSCGSRTQPSSVCPRASAPTIFRRMQAYIERAECRHREHLGTARLPDRDLALRRHQGLRQRRQGRRHRGDEVLHQCEDLFAALAAVSPTCRSAGRERGQRLRRGWFRKQVKGAGCDQPYRRRVQHVKGAPTTGRHAIPIAATRDHFWRAMRGRSCINRSRRPASRPSPRPKGSGSRIRPGGVSWISMAIPSIISAMAIPGWWRRSRTAA